MIHPRRLKGTSGNIARYYTIGDYYTKGGDEPSQWGGKLAPELGLEGKVDPHVFAELLAGRVAGQQLGRHRGDGEIQHHPGWDFAVNAPKSISIMALVAGDSRIIEAHERAVTTALLYLEEHASLRRRKDGEIIHETTGRLLFARFTEHASRDLDPHLHTHVVVLNMTNREGGGPMASLETRAMFAEQMVAGQVYRNELARDLREQGFEIEFDPRRGLFEIAGVPKDFIRDTSQRSRKIDAHAQEHGLAGQAARRASFYETRGAKVKVGLDDLKAQWAERAKPYVKELADLGSQAADREGQGLEFDPMASRRAALFGIRQAETREAVSNLGSLYRHALASHVGEVGLTDVRPLITEHEARRKLLAAREPTGDRPLTRGRTTRRSARLEQALSRELALAMDDARPIASSDRLLVRLERAGLNPAQEQALVMLASSRDRVTGLHGVAGAGKSTLMRTLAEAAEPGTRFLALAPTSSAAANLGDGARVDARTVASLLAGGGHGITDTHVLLVDEAGQLGNRQAQRLLQISRETGARLILLGDNRQTGAIEQGKPFWLLQRLGLPTAELTESMRQETRMMKAAVTEARAGNYASSMEKLDKVVSGVSAERLARGLVEEWTRLGSETRQTTNILVLENKTRILVNAKIRGTLKSEGAIAAEDVRLSVLTPAGMTAQEKHLARFYSGGQVVMFARDLAAPGIARDTEYRVVGLAQDANGRQLVRLVDENGRMIRWDPRLGQARHVNVFDRKERELAEGDRIQWRLVNRELDLKNAERGTVEKLEGGLATIRWDRGERVQTIDLSRHKTWDHGYAETVYSAQSKTYARIYVLAPVNSALVNGQNYYTAITRARLGVKLWTESEKKLVEKLEARSGEKTSALEGLGRLDRDTVRAYADRHAGRLAQALEDQQHRRQDRRDQLLERQLDQRRSPQGLGEHLAEGARGIAEIMDRILKSALDRRASTGRSHAHAGRGHASPAADQDHQKSNDRSGFDR
ncbi:MobF family relaxase [Novosphingobium mangrovi (ex Huang et al. 2023)]|uniref:Relaxase domain-containing protein n=1 Tax=Novosphingobium mangrovi (ex Huang et al. 2023) TaxID=2976432 RepID=A0ABT2IA87_9SPHN|nr:MobF family relaxase [Novosphingobium mangrovi (ex Huang et al. 2023)]MCT2401740.1 relaxase domain-containing protein [Novosphingobium mangrovi (ex Huang et al. 2023)]